MDVAAFSSDIDELVNAFIKIEGVELSQIKELWRSRSFSFIHEARPNHVDPAFFMQALYSCALGHIEEDVSWSEKLGGLYVLYILYETQLCNPPFKIYLSKDDLENIYSLVKEAKKKGTLIALRVVQRMMVKNSFLFGSVTTNQKRMKDAVDKLSSKSAERLQLARRRFLTGFPAHQHFEGDLVRELGLNELAMLNEEYRMVKQRLYNGATQNAEDCPNELIAHGEILGDELKEDAIAWMEYRNSFSQNKGDEDGFGMELEQTLEEE